MRNTKLQGISDEMFDSLESNECLTATGGNTVTHTSRFTHIGRLIDFVIDTVND
ncbi:MAG TPA: hypothetical protein VEZ90_17920 [Blastocatellia bacterium]|nr:hypothetical protein [Blastocatellia bacterium]